MSRLRPLRGNIRRQATIPHRGRIHRHVESARPYSRASPRGGGVRPRGYNVSTDFPLRMSRRVHLDACASARLAESGDEILHAIAGKRPCQVCRRNCALSESSTEGTRSSGGCLWCRPVDRPPRHLWPPWRLHECLRLFAPADVLRIQLVYDPRVKVNIEGDTSGSTCLSRRRHDVVATEVHGEFRQRRTGGRRCAACRRSCDLSRSRSYLGDAGRCLTAARRNRRRQ